MLLAVLRKKRWTYDYQSGDGYYAGGGFVPGLHRTRTSALRAARRSLLFPRTAAPARNTPVPVPEEVLYDSLEVSVHASPPRTC